ncbi:DUF4373 domain-containing protein [Paenibacillus aurantiacus]|uniref:DUF4373 domain-containing protein n=1 Tax=Paenibacillus aurantiacus TaxID=1936118 RepID=A0ABV5KYQ3_9BACL
MARPKKEGLEYFPMDVDIIDDDKLVVPIAKYGNRGFGVIVRLMMEVYRNSYFYPWTEKEQYVFAMKINEDVNYVREVVSECINWGFFHQKLHEEHQILTSAGFQKRYLLAAGRRKEATIRPEFLLLEDAKNVSATETPVFDDNNHGKNDSMSAESPQKKVKESKLNNKHRYAEFVTMKESEYQKLIDAYGKTQTDRMIAMLDNYKGSKGRTYKDDYRAILSWVVEKAGAKRIDSHDEPPVVNKQAREDAFREWVREGNDPAEFRFEQ